MNCGLKAFRVDVARELDLYGELHRFIPVLAHDLGFRVTEIGVNHRPREHGRSRYGMERYARGFLDLLTVTFMSRYRHRPLHLFGGLGLAARHDRDRDPRLPDDREDHRRADRQAAAAPARRAPRRGRDPVPLARPPLRAGHEPAPRAPARTRRPTLEARRRDPAIAGEGALLRDVRPHVPPQHAGRLVPPPRGGDGRRAAPGGVGAAQLVGRPRPARAHGTRRRRPRP